MLTVSDNNQHSSLQSNLSQLMFNVIKHFVRLCKICLSKLKIRRDVQKGFLWDFEKDFRQNHQTLHQITTFTWENSEPKCN
jgi:hypothetical protein